MQVWIVGKINSADHRRWEFQGVYDDEKKAIEVCEDETWFVGPVEMNEHIPTGSVAWPGAFYPKAPDAPLSNASSPTYLVSGDGKVLIPAVPDVADAACPECSTWFAFGMDCQLCNRKSPHGAH